MSASIALAYNQYLPPPPPPSTIPYIPQQSTNIFYPPPAGPTIVAPKQKPLPPIPLLDPKLKKFPVDLDLADFADRNQYPDEHCFFKVKGKSDIVEFIPIGGGEDSKESYGVWNFPTGTCNLEANQCSYGKRVKVRNPFNNKKHNPPVMFVYDEPVVSQYRGFPVIPYKNVEDIDFSQCMPTWNGFVEIDDLKVREYEAPKRNYSQQSCYHSFNAGHKGAIFCDSEKCRLTENQYCAQKNGQCYLNDYPLKTKDGKSVTIMENLVSINWDFCMDAAGALIPEDGGPPYEERFTPGCSYRVEAPNYQDRQYGNVIDFLVKCDENRCYMPGLDFDMKKKMYWTMSDDKRIYTKTPPLREFLTINWQCLDAKKVPDYNKNLLCPVISHSGDWKASACRLCYENKKFVYKDCKVPYNEVGQRSDIPAEMLDYNLFEEVQFLAEKMQQLQQEKYEIDFEPDWFLILNRAISIHGRTIDEEQRYRLAFLMAEFRRLEDPQEEDVQKLRRQIASFLTADIKKLIDSEIEQQRAGMCMICRTSKQEVRLSQPAIREACAMCNTK